MIVNKITEATIYESIRDQLQEDKLWGDIRRTAKTNPTLKQALDEAILIYTLSK